MRVSKVFHMKASPDAATVMSPGQVIRAARQRTGLSRERLAVEAGVSTSTIARLETRERLPNIAALVRIAERVNVHVADLLPAPKSAA